VSQLVTSKINNIYLKKGAELFFKSGEFIVDKTAKFLEKTKTSTHLKDSSDPSKMTKKPGTE
jgi:hypothetical protein